MEYNNFKEKLIRDLEEYQIINKENKEQYLNEKQIKRLYEYMMYILEKNQYINLTAIKEENKFIERHIVDSLYILKYINLLENKIGKKRYLDLGTGGGFPLVPLKITLGFKSYGLDSILKKLKVIDEKENINIIHERAEIAAHNNKYRETFDLVTTRAVSSLDNVIMYMSGFVKKNGIAVLLRGKEENINEDIVKKYGFVISKKEKYELYGEERNIIILRKVKKLNSDLPIKEGKFYKENK